MDATGQNTSCVILVNLIAMIVRVKTCQGMGRSNRRALQMKVTINQTT